MDAVQRCDGGIAHSSRRAAGSRDPLTPAAMGRMWQTCCTPMAPSPARLGYGLSALRQSRRHHNTGSASRALLASTKARDLQLVHHVACTQPMLPTRCLASFWHRRWPFGIATASWRLVCSRDQNDAAPLCLSDQAAKHCGHGLGFSTGSTCHVCVLTAPRKKRYMLPCTRHALHACMQQQQPLLASNSYTAPKLGRER